MPPKDIYEVNYENSSLLSPIEAQILTQYQLLATQLNTLSNEIKDLNRSAVTDSAATSTSATQREKGRGNVSADGNADKLLDNMRNLEVKIGLVYTLFKGAVYSLFLRQEEDVNLQSDIEKQREEHDSERNQDQEQETGEEQDRHEESRRDRERQYRE